MTDVSEPPDSLPGLSFDDHSVDPEAQLVVSDFLDYTEYLPSDLIRSHTLIRQLDQAYIDAAAHVHDLTRQYAKLPQLPTAEKPDAIQLRRDISSALERAQNCRAASHAEAVRIHELVKKHEVRLGLIKTKLQALPKPPSRDPTPVLLSPQAIKARKGEQTLKLTVQEKRRRKVLVLDNLPAHVGADELSGQEDQTGISPMNVRPAPKPRSARLPKGPRTPKARTPRTPAERRVGADGRPLHYRVSTISTSNALAMLTPPPEDAQAGSKWRPWLKLTEYELAVIRKAMKKNVQWVPSAAMIHRYLADHGRGLERYQIEKAKAETSGQQILDEEPDSKDLAALSGVTSPGMQLESESQQIAETDDNIVNGVDGDGDVDMVDAPAEAPQPEEKAIADYFTQGPRPRTRRATQDAMPMDEVNKKTSEVLLSMKNIFDQPPTPSAATDVPEIITDTGRSNRKRKRGAAKEASAASAASETPAATSPIQENKRLKVSNAGSSLAPPKSPAESVASVRSLTRTRIVPLAPEGATSPLPSATPKEKEVETVESSTKPAVPAFVQPTAAQFRSRRSPAAPKDAIPEKEAEPAVQLDLPQPSRASTRSRGSASAKAASVEPPPSKREMAEIRRLSNNDQFTRSLPIIGPRSSRRKPPGVVTTEEGGRGKVSIGRRKTKPKPKRAKKAGQDKTAEPDEDDPVDPDEQTYCTCNQVSYGIMVACDNEKCEREWFHLDCVGLKAPPRARQKWYCEACAEKLHIDQEGNALPSHTSNSRRK